MRTTRDPYAKPERPRLKPSAADYFNDTIWLLMIARIAAIGAGIGAGALLAEPITRAIVAAVNYWAGI